MKINFLNSIKKYNMLSHGMTVCVGVSGGADSMCLLHLLNDIRSEYELKIIAAHVNHCIRGAEADRDEEFVVKFCKDNGIEIAVGRIDVPKEAQISGESIELCARRLRYEFFDQLNADVIATAHTGSDRIETLLMNLARGASLDGLCSIPPVRGNIIRPLLQFTRHDIERYCVEHNIGFVTDSTNLSDDYTRNRFRHRVVAELIDIYPAFESNALRCLELINDENEILDAIAADKMQNSICTDLSLNCRELKNLNEALKRRIVVNFLKFNNIFDFSYKHIVSLADNMQNKFSLMLPSGIRVSCNSGYLFVDKLSATESVNCFDDFEFDKNKDVVFCSGDSIIRVYSSDSVPECNLNNCFIVDFDKTDDILLFRSRAQGDIIHLGKRKCTKKIKKLFNELKIPVDKRDGIAFLTDKDGVIFVEGIGVDSTRCIDRNTKKYLIIELKGC